MADTEMREPATFQEIRDILRQVSESQKETDRRMQETDRRMRELNELFTSQWGKLIETLVDGDLIKLLIERGITVDYTFNNLKRDHDGRTWEIDIVGSHIWFVREAGDLVGLIR